jgi:tRNA A-37 threonylcarbamoyl transferase component Bud32
MESKTKEETEKVDLEEIISSFKVQDKKVLRIYLKEIWLDLCQRNKEKENVGITKITFSSYYQLPGIILDRLFNVLDSNKSGFLESNEFISGMITLFCDEFDATSKFIFDFYDYNKCGKITKEDIRTVLSYITLSQEIQNYKDRVHSQKELYDILEKCFAKLKSEEMGYKEFKKVIENENSDIYLMILLFLYEKKPFTKATLLAYSKKIKTSPTNSPPKSPSKRIASPTKNSSFSPYAYFKRGHKRTSTLKEENFITNNNLFHSPKVLRRTKNRHSTTNFDIINLVPTPNTNYSKYDSNVYETKTSNFNNEHYSPIHRKNKRNLKDLAKGQNLVKLNMEKKDSTINNINFNEAALQPVFKQIKNANNEKDSDSASNISGDLNDIKKEKNINLELEDYSDENSDEEEEKENVVQNEGYLIKFTDNKLKKIWFKLVGKDLFYFKNKNQDIHKGMHNLSGVFINEEEPKEINGKKYYCFSMTYPKKSRLYYVEKENEYKTWIEKLKIATGYTNLTDIYDIKQKLGNGKFGLIKLGINKKTNKKVAIKIMSKQKMDNSDLELVRTEIEILKICQHPNIIQLYDVFENINYFYIIMEYCEGGDLFSYLEKRNFRLPEKMAAKFMHKMCAAVYYIHSYGIAHRDLKPENVLMTSNDENADLRILDFGLSKIIGPNEKTREPYGTLSYVAPEVLLDIPYGKEVDLFSLGVITYLMLSGSLPFDDKKSEEEIARKTVNEDPPYKGSIWKTISKEAKDFIKGLLQKNPEERMNIKEALEHEWFHKFDKTGNNVILARRFNKDIKKNEFELYTNTH